MCRCAAAKYEELAGLCDIGSCPDPTESKSPCSLHKTCNFPRVNELLNLADTSKRYMSCRTGELSKAIAEWQRLKTLVLDSVSWPITKRVYNMALDEIVGWFQQAQRPGFTKATVNAWRYRSGRGLGSSSIIIRMSALANWQRRPLITGCSHPSWLQGSVV